MEIKNKLIIIIKSKIDNFDKRNFLRYIKTFNVIFLIKITRRTIGAHGYNLLQNELATLWYKMLPNYRNLVSSFAIL